MNRCEDTNQVAPLAHPFERLEMAHLPSLRLWSCLPGLDNHDSNLILTSVTLRFHALRLPHELLDQQEVLINAHAPAETFTTISEVNYGRHNVGSSVSDLAGNVVEQKAYPLDSYCRCISVYCNGGKQVPKYCQLQNN